MHPRTLYAALLLAALAAPAVALQEAKPVVAATLERARRTFQAADRSADGRIERAELELARVKVTGDGGGVRGSRSRWQHLLEPR